MKLIARAQDIPDSNPLPGVQATITRQSDGVTVATGSTDTDGWVELTANGAPGDVFIDYYRGTDRFRDDSRSMRPFGAFSPAEFQQTVADVIGDGVVPYGDGFSITAGASSVTVGTGAAVLNGVLGVWYTSTTVTVSNGSRALAVLYSGTGQLTLVDVAVADLTSNHLSLYTYTVSGGSVTGVTDVRPPILEGIVTKKPTLQSVVRTSTGDTSNSSGEASGTELTLSLLSGRTYDIEATSSVISRATAGAIAVQIDGNLSSYVANGGDITTTIINVHSRSVVGGGSCTVRLYERSDTALTSIVNDLTYGSFGTGNDNFNSPQQVAVDSSGNVYVADTANNRVKRHDSSGTYVSAITGITNPSGVAVDASGNVYIAGMVGSNSVVRKYNSSHVLQWTKTWGTGVNLSLKHVAVGSTYVYVASQVSDAVLITDIATGTDSFELAGSASGSYASVNPLGVAVDSTYVYVVDTGNTRITKFFSNGATVSSWGSSGSADGQFTTPVGIAVNPVNGNIFVTDTGRDDIQEFTSTGTFVQVVATGLNNPAGVAVTSGEAVYTTDTNNNRVKRYAEVASSFTYDSAVLFARAIPRS